MSEHQIIFSTEMVRAILDGRKTQTRRICKDQTAKSYQWLDKCETYPSSLVDGYTGCAKDCDFSFLLPTKCPYVKVGDMLWVRETWWDLGYWYKGKWFGRTSNHKIGPKYVADGEPEGVIAKHKRSHLICKWRKRPSIFMPRWAARIFLEVTNIRVEKVQDIDNNWEDCLREGITAPDICEAHGVHYKALLMFKDLWDSINFKRGYGWDKNPWVWVIEFKRRP